MKKTSLFILIVGAAFSSMGQMPYNGSNPYDQAGELHNDIVNYVKDNPPKTISNKSIAQAEDEYLMEIHSSASASEFVLSQDYVNFSRGFKSSADKEQFLMDEGGFTPNGARYYSQMIKGLAHFDYETLYNTLVSLEDEIADDKSLNGSEKRVLLAACSIGRHSANNWMSNTSGTSTEQKEVWTEDAIGAVKGGIIGALDGGIITLGAAIIPGWLGGAVIGAAKASLGAYLDNLLTD